MLLAAKSQVETLEREASTTKTQLSAAKEMLCIKNSALSNALRENKMLKQEVDEFKTYTKDSSSIHEDNCLLQCRVEEAKTELLKAKKQVAVLSGQLEETNKLARNAIEKAQKKESERWVSCGLLVFVFFFPLLFINGSFRLFPPRVFT